MNKAKLTCPSCGYGQEIGIPEMGCLAFHRCEKCGEVISVPKESNNCCVVCEYSDKKCAGALSKSGVGHLASESRDLASKWTTLLKLWGPPVLLILISSIGANNLWWAIEISGVLWVIGIVWIGAFCLKNALRCGRIHCWLIGISYPLLALYALAITLGYVTTPWNTFWNIFLLVTILTFVPEWFGKKYFKR